MLLRFSIVQMFPRPVEFEMLMVDKVVLVEEERATLLGLETPEGVLLGMEMPLS
jgi:hypothetical protein